MKRRRSIVAAVAAVLLVSSVVSAAQAAPSAFLTLVGSGFTDPVVVTYAPGRQDLFVVQQNGYIKIVGGGTFLDIHTKIACCGEQGLLGLAFHPDYNNSAATGFRRFYVYYTRSSDGALVIAEYRRSSGNVNTADPNSFRQLMVISHPGHANHNGGWLAFKGSLLYASTGDGGGVGDAANNAQNKGVLLGKILRINPLPSGSSAYTIPSTNPFVGRTGRDEIWAYGLRNPWRCSFDRSTGYLWCGDVGQSKYEEIDRHPDGRGKNFGWRLLEGRHYYNWPGHTSGNLCTSTCRTMPIAEYAHTAFGGGNCAVTGGYVSRRSGALLNGKYIFGDYCSGKLWTISAGFAAGGALPSPVVTAGFNISCFGEGADGRIYVCDLNGGAIYRVTDS